MKKYCLILAAGDGKRMKSDKPKALAEVLFKPMIGWVLDSAEKAGMDRTAVVVGSGRQQLEDYLGSCGEYDIYEQKERRGTAHAVMAAREFVRSAEKDGAALFVCCADAPFTDVDTMLSSYEAHIESGNDITVISAVIASPRGYGRIMRKNGELSEIIEEKDCTPVQRGIKEVNSGLYWFSPSFLKTLPIS